MKHSAYILLAAVIVMAGCCSGKPRSKYVKVYGDTLKVNTIELGRKIEGFRGPVPLEVSVVDGKVAEIKLLDNMETPRYLDTVVTTLLPKWKGLTVKEAAALEVDAVTGSTWSSNAIIENMHLALKELRK